MPQPSSRKYAALVQACRQHHAAARFREGMQQGVVDEVDHDLAERSGIAVHHDARRHLQLEAMRDGNLMSEPVEFTGPGGSAVTVRRGEEPVAH